MYTSPIMVNIGVEKTISLNQLNKIQAFLNNRCRKSAYKRRLKHEKLFLKILRAITEQY